MSINSNSFIGFVVIAILRTEAAGAGRGEEAIGGGGISDVPGTKRAGGGKSDSPYLPATTGIGGTAGI